MSDLIKDSLADAKSLKKLAIENAKAQLEETFIPKIKSLVTKKLREEEDDLEDDEPTDVTDDEDDTDPVTEDDEPTDDDSDTDLDVTDDEDDTDPVTEDDEPTDDSEDDLEDDEDIDDQELEEIIKELEGDLDSTDDDSEDDTDPVTEDDEPTDDDGDIDLDVTDDEDDTDPVTEDDEPTDDSEDDSEDDSDEDDGDLDLEEIFGTRKDNTSAKLRTENRKLKKALVYMRKQMNEVTLLNSKLLYTNKIFKRYSLGESQKRKVINTFDRAKSLREVKLVFTSLTESFNGNVKRNPLRENFASRKLSSTKPNSRIVEGVDVSLKKRLKELAHIK